MLNFQRKSAVSRFLIPFRFLEEPADGRTGPGGRALKRGESLITRRTHPDRLLGWILYAIRFELISPLGGWLLRTKYKRKARRIGRNVWMDVHVELTGREIHVDDAVYIGPHCRLYGSGGIWIGEGTIFGPEVTVISAMPSYDDPETLPFDTPSRPMPVRIGKGVWVGYGAILCPGITVGEGAVIGMGAVVTEDVPPGAVVGGNPARVIRERDGGLIRALLAEERFFVRHRAVMFRKRRRAGEVVEGRHPGSDPGNP